MGTTANDGFELVRKAGPLEVLTDLFHDLGIQSNVRVSCEYSHETKKLSPPRVFRALQQVIQDIPALGIIGVSQPSEKKVGNHRIWEARLSSIRFCDCVEFLNESNTSSDTALAKIFEDVHNHWFDTQDTTKPWWRLLIVNGSNAIFVFHHSIGDGISGYAFHKHLLAALNANDTDQDSENQVVGDQIFTIQKGSHEEEPIAIDEIDEKLSWLHVIRTFLFWNVMRIFVRPKYFLFSDAKVTNTYPTFSKPFPVEERTRSRVETLRIGRATMEKCLASCREHQTSFTALLHTIISITFAADIYPKAKVGFTRVAVNIRPLLRRDPGPDVFTNASATYYRTHLLGKYRAASQDGKLDRNAVWMLAAAYKKHMNDSIYKSDDVLQGYLTCRLLGEDNEEVGSFYGLGLYLNNSFLISNVGVFHPKDDMKAGGWSVKDVGFGAAAIRAAVGDYGPVFSVASTKNGDCVIAATWEDGVLKEEMIKKVLSAVFERLESLV
ncbi:alcohol acetyltransferase [Rhexocercosporidium sp. MPI-PUGE-AT-0058]|nr:alcohol acetyltransferase [Rhexocercosporidium sp. MPI-PUGE-AT-0058]